MFEASVFLGLPLNNELLAQVNGLDSQIKALFIGQDPDSIYLQELSLPEGHFLGKYVGHICELSHLNMLQTNIYSLLEKILPSSSNWRDIPLVLISVKTPIYTS